MKTIALILAGLFIIYTGRAQTLRGKVMENRTDIMLSGTKVENQTQHTNSVTDPFGNFTIQAKKGDLVCFSGLNYVADTIYLINLKNLTVLLELRSNLLKEVKIKNRTVNTSGFTAAPQTGPFGSHTVLYLPGGGLKVMLFGSSTGAKKRNKLEQMELKGQKEQEIARVFSVNNIKDYVPLNGQELYNFVMKYTPDIKTFYSSSFNLAVYVNDSYKDFLKVPEDKRKSSTYINLNNGGQ